MARKHCKLTNIKEYQMKIRQCEHQNVRGHMHLYHHIIEGSLEVKLPTIWTVGKAEVGRVRGEKRRREKIREEKE